MSIIDSHCHLYKFNTSDIYRFINENKIKIIAVSDDLESSKKTLSLAERISGIIPCIGIHPWTIADHKEYITEIKSIIDILENNDYIKCIGEVGLDKKFIPIDMYNKLLESFKIFINYAASNNMVLNIHAAGAWREAFNIVYRASINRAIFHWYTGPLDLLKDICGSGYYITINPAIKIQNKHRVVAEKADLKCIMVESDGPYNYRGLNLEPPLILDTVNIIARLKSVKEDIIINAITNNFLSLFK